MGVRITEARDFLNSPVVKTSPSNMWVRSLVGEIRSHMPPAQKKAKTLNRSNIVTNLIKTFRVVHIKKEKKRMREVLIWLRLGCI